MLDRRVIQTYAFAAVGVIGAIPIMFLPRMIFSNPAAADGAYVVATVASLAIALAWAFWFAPAAFRRADEFVQERSKFAWCWGSLPGAAFAACLYAVMGVGGAPGLLDDVTPVRAFGLGMACLLGIQLFVAFVMSAWWRATKR